jgi:hypothetical protein
LLFSSATYWQVEPFFEALHERREGLQVHGRAQQPAPLLPRLTEAEKGVIPVLHAFSSELHAYLIVELLCGPTLSCYNFFYKYTFFL